MVRNKIYGDLTYGNIVPTYVGAPTSELDDLGKKLEGDYNTALDYRDKLETVAANTSVRDPNYKIIKGAIDKINSDLKQHSEKGDWEYAMNSVRNSARDFVTNPLVKGAIQDKQKYDAWLNDLQSNNKILDSDKQYAITKSKLENSSSLEYDPQTGQYKNMFSGSSAPDFVDVNKKIQEVIKDLNPSTRAILLQRANQKGYLQHGSIEELSPEQLRDVAKDVVMGDESVRSYMNYQTEKQNFYNRLTKDENGNLTLREYTPEDLMSVGILSKDKKAYIPKTNDSGQILYKDSSGKEYDPSKDKIVQTKFGLYSVNKKGQADKKLTPALEVSEELMNGVRDSEGNIVVPGLFNSDGSFNSDVAESQIKGILNNQQYESYLDFADNFAYSKENIEYKEDWMMKQEREFAHDKAMKDYEFQLNNQDFYVNMLMNLPENSSRTLEPSAAKALFNDGKADFRNLILEFAKDNKIKGLTAEQQRLIPYANRLNELFSETLMDKIVNTFDPFSMSTEQLSKYESIVRTPEIKQILETTGLSKEQLLQFYKTYNDLSGKEKEAVETLGKIMQLPSAPVSLQDKDNLKNVDGTIQIGVNGTFDSNQLGLSDEEINNLNEVFGKKILTTTKKGTFKNPISQYQVSGWLEHKPSYEAQQKYNSNYGTSKYTNYHRDLFNQQTMYNANQKEKQRFGVNRDLINAPLQTKNVVAANLGNTLKNKDLSQTFTIQGKEYSGQALYDKFMESFYNASSYEELSAVVDDIFALRDQLKDR